MAMQLSVCVDTEVSSALWALAPSLQSAPAVEDAVWWARGVSAVVAHVLALKHHGAHCRAISKCLVIRFLAMHHHLDVRGCLLLEFRATMVLFLDFLNARPFSLSVLLLVVLELHFAESHALLVRLPPKMFSLLVESHRLFALEMRLLQA